MPGGIEALVLEWSDPDKIAITVGWTRIANRNAAAAFAATVRATKRSSNGLTAIGSAMLAAGRRLRPHAGAGRAPGHRHFRRRHGQFRRAAGRVRDTLVAHGITINGLAILSEEPWLDEYYRRT